MRSSKSAKPAGSPKTAIRTLLVANRGEIACRIERTAREMGLKTLRVRAADDAGDGIEISSYLNIREVVDAAKKAGADAIHPGYGFLAENPAFADAAEDAGLTFIGPPADAMRALGDKAAARKTARELGVPVTEGDGPFTDVHEIEVAAKRLGVPLMLKASAGGGGKGMKRVTDLKHLREEILAAQRETKAAFGDDRLIVERYVKPARHVEIQVFGDGRRAIAIGERECSLQRRHQKIIEESSSTAVDETLREKLFDAARKLAEHVGYRSAGTMEFLLGPDGRFYFMEMNARLQVEHPVTELRTGLDLVRLQIEVAQGGPLPAQEDLVFRGHAIEARLCAEDPRHRFLPSAGRLLDVRWPTTVRVDTAPWTEVTTHYDSLLAKLIAWAPDRDQARRRLIDALRQTIVLGVYTNQSFLIELLESDAFTRGETFTTTVDEWSFKPHDPPKILAIAAALAMRAPARKGKHSSPWTTLGNWRLG